MALPGRGDDDDRKLSTWLERQPWSATATDVLRVAGDRCAFKRERKDELSISDVFFAMAETGRGDLESAKFFRLELDENKYRRLYEAYFETDAGSEQPDVLNRKPEVDAQFLFLLDVTNKISAETKSDRLSR